MLDIKDKATNVELQKMNNLLTFPVGAVVEFYGKVGDIPRGWLALDGSWKSIGDYPVLFKLLSESGKVTLFTVTDFKLPIVTEKIVKV